MSKFKYDIFISYKRGKNESNENGYKYLGVSVARMIKQAFEIEGYKVYFDCDTGDVKGSKHYIRQSKLVLLLLTGYSFSYTDDGKAEPSDGFEEELEEISKLEPVVKLKEKTKNEKELEEISKLEPVDRLTEMIKLVKKHDEIPKLKIVLNEMLILERELDVISKRDPDVKLKEVKKLKKKIESIEKGIREELHNDFNKSFYKNRKTTKVLALNIDGTFEENNKKKYDYGGYGWVLAVAQISHRQLSTANNENTRAQLQTRSADHFDNDFMDLLNKIKSNRKEDDYNIRPRRPSIKKLKKRIKILVSSLIIACIILPVITLLWYKDRTTLITSSLLKNIITNEKKLKTCRIDMLVEYPPNKNIFDINYVEKPTDKNEKEQCPVVGVDDPMPVDELKKEHPEWFKDPYRLLEFDLGTVELVSYVFQKTSDTSITETALLEDLLRKKIFQKDTSYHVMMGLHQTGDKWLNILYKKYTDMYPDMLKKEPKSDSLSVEEFRDSLVDAKFRPYHGDYKAIIKEKTKINKTVIVFENTTVQKYIIDSIPVHAQIIKTKQDSLNLRAYTLVKYDATSNPNGGKIIYTNNQNQFFKQLKCPNYNVLTEKDFDYFENGHKVKDVIRREAGW